jgi:C4-dicarboxylate transporter DctM subunit
MFILGSTKAFGQLVTIYDIPETILNLFQVLANHPEIVMLLIGIFYIFINNITISGWFANT